MGHLVPDPPRPPDFYECDFCSTRYLGHVASCTQCGSVNFTAVAPVVPAPPAQAFSPRDGDRPKPKPPVMPKPDNGTDKK